MSYDYQVEKSIPTVVSVLHHYTLQNNYSRQSMIQQWNYACIETLNSWMKMRRVVFWVNIKIDNFVLGKTTRFERDFSCLSEDNLTPLCEVIDLKGFHQLRSNLILPCSYHLPFNESLFCICPTRRELHHHYKI